MRLVAAELLAMRKRAATYVVLAVLLVIMTIIYVVVGYTTGATGTGGFAGDILTFPDAYSVLVQFVFDLGSLMAVTYAAAVAGGDWSWGIPRVVIARGESRIAYVLAKGAALVVVLAIGVVIAYAVGILLTFVAAGMAGVDAGNPFGPRGVEQLGRSLALGFPVLLERAAIAFAVATLLRSQLAGIVIGIVLYIGEGIAAGILFAIQFAGRFQSPDNFSLEPVGPEWYQHLPFSVGDSVLAEIAPREAGGGGGFEEILLRPVPIELALVAVALYGVAAIAIAVIAVWRAEIAA